MNHSRGAVSENCSYSISRFLILHPTLHWICLAWPSFVEEIRLGFIVESPGEIPRREFFRKQ